MSLDEGKNMERKIMDRLRNTDNALENTKGELAELKLKLSAAEGRVNGLEAQLAQIEGKHL